MKYKIMAVIMCMLLVSGGWACAQEDARIGILAMENGTAEDAAVAWYAEKRCIELGTAYMIVTENQTVSVEDCLADLLNWGAQSVILPPSFADRTEDIRLIKTEMSVVCVGSQIGGVYCVAPDDYDIGVSSAYCLAEKLEGAGSIAVMCGSDEAARLRMEGFLDTIGEIAPDVRVLSCEELEADWAGGAEAMGRILKNSDCLDGLFVTDDAIALEAVKAAQAAGRSDLHSVISCGGSQEYLRLATQNEDMEMICVLRIPTAAEAAADMAYTLARGLAVEPVRYCETEIVENGDAAAYLDANCPY